MCFWRPAVAWPNVQFAFGGPDISSMIRPRQHKLALGMPLKLGRASCCPVAAGEPAPSAPVARHIERVESGFRELSAIRFPIARVPSSHSASRARRDCAGTSRIVGCALRRDRAPDQACRLSPTDLLLKFRRCKMSVRGQREVRVRTQRRASRVSDVPSPAHLPTYSWLGARLRERKQLCPAFLRGEQFYTDAIGG
jgi:hypothetical protein